jgi:hypothetical protein
VQLALDGVEQGVHIGYTGDRSRFRDCDNLVSADENPDAITADLAKEVSKGRMTGRRRLAPHPPPLVAAQWRLNQ